MHELGHSFAILQDEYESEHSTGNPALTNIVNSVHVSTSSDPTVVSWKDWIGFTDDLGTVDVYEGGYYRSTGVWRPTLDSKMRSNNQEFNAPQKEAFINKFYEIIGDYASLKIHSLIETQVITPDDSLFNFDWKLGGQVTEGTGNRLSLTDYIKSQANGDIDINLTLEVTDNTGKIRKAEVIEEATVNLSHTPSITKQTMSISDLNYIKTAPANYFIEGNASNNLIELAGDTGSMSYVDGGTGNDTIEGGLGNDILNGGVGNDVINGDDGSDVIDGGPGTDTLNYSSLTTSVSLNLSNGKAIIGDHTDLLSNIEWITGSNYSDSLTGNSESNKIEGSSGDDTIDGGSGTDTVSFAGLISEYTAVESGYSIIVTDTDASRDGIDTVTSIEAFEFGGTSAFLSDLLNPTDVDNGVYRFFNLGTGTHFYSASPVERDYIINTYDQFNYEGGSFKSAGVASSDTAGVHRFFNTQLGTHFFTQNDAEKENVVATLPHYSYEGIEYQAYTSQVDDSIALYRFFNTVNGAHFFTPSEGERDSVIENLPVYNYEGIAYYVDAIV
jgi:Ca2+-binding RTX toxin-like protein